MADLKIVLIQGMPVTPKKELSALGREALEAIIDQLKEVIGDPDSADASVFANVHVFTAQAPEAVVVAEQLAELFSPHDAKRMSWLNLGQPTIDEMAVELRQLANNSTVILVVPNVAAAKALTELSDRPVPDPNPRGLILLTFDTAPQSDTAQGQWLLRRANGF
ncbi:MAG TPA: hypothetical protein VI322_02485 [Candidatus Saccharimonadia bacterium]